jgi:DNA recombination protein RmuC
MLQLLIIILTAAVLTIVILLWRTLENIKNAQQNTSQGLQQSLISGQDAVNKNLQFHSQTLEKLNNQLGQLQGSSQKIMELGGDIKSLQQILASPKLRGGLGEWQLENILSALLPADSFTIQHTFGDGKKVDALVKMPDYSVPIDAKFPLENFQKLQKSENEVEAKKLRREFLRDVQKHIDKIAESYIKPDQGTLDFAMMFIPAENIYYEAMIKNDADTISIADYAMEKKVFPVSPNLLYVYLMTVVMGLHGLQIEKQAAEIRQNLKALNVSFAKFVSNHWETLGGHIRNAYTKYDDGQKELNKIAAQLTQMQDKETPGKTGENNPR